MITGKKAVILSIIFAVLMLSIVMLFLQSGLKPSDEKSRTHTIGSELLSEATSKSGENQTDTSQAAFTGTDIPQTTEEMTYTSDYSTADIPETSAPAIFPEKGIPVLMYHSISTDPVNSLCVSETQLEEEMKWLYDNNYNALTVDELYNILVLGDTPPEKPVLITFDDGYLNNYEAGWPILKKYGFHATFFIITNLMGSDYMDWEQLKELVKEGNSIGSHTVNHYDLAIISKERQRYELYESKLILEKQLGISIKALCYPSGRYDETTIALLSELGYTLAFTTKPGRVLADSVQYELKRVRISNKMPLSSFIASVSY